MNLKDVVEITKIFNSLPGNRNDRLEKSINQYLGNGKICKIIDGINFYTNEGEFKSINDSMVSYYSSTNKSSYYIDTHTRFAIVSIADNKLISTEIISKEFNLPRNIFDWSEDDFLMAKLAGVG